MKSTKTALGFFFALLPILYCGGLVYYFVGVPGRMRSSLPLPSGATDGIMKELGPTVIGLGAFGILFALMFVLKVMRAATGRTARTPAAKVEIDEGEPFDADAALARYMARKAAGEVDEPVAPTPASTGGGFGRKGV